MSDEIKAQVEATIVRLESIVQNQSVLDNLWLSVKQLLLDELDTLPDLPKSNQKKKNRNFRKSQPFWNNNIEDAWKEVCRSEKVYLKCKASFHCNLAQKQQFQAEFKNAQKIFDRKFRYYKRKHKAQEFIDLENLSKNNPAEMWAKFKKLSNPTSTKAVLEIVRADETISNDKKEVLKRWHTDISNLFSRL